MPQPIKLTYAEVVEAGRKAYLEGRLSAQGPTPDCAYRDRSGRPCIIGAALPDNLAERGTQFNLTIKGMVDDGFVTTDDLDALTKLQEAHDNWASRYTGGEAELRKLLNIEEAA